MRSIITYGPRIDYQLCKGCRECYEVCPQDVFGWDKEKQIPTISYRAECSVCCACEVSCPEIAIDVLLPLHLRIDMGIYPESQKV